MCAFCSYRIGTEVEEHAYGGSTYDTCGGCGYVCTHPASVGTTRYYTDKTLTTHSWYTLCNECNGVVATVADHVENHTFDDKGVCTVCGYQCTNGEGFPIEGKGEYVDAHTCKMWMQCTNCLGFHKYSTGSHIFDDDGCDKVCAYCGFFQHGIHEYPSVYTDGKCTKCGKICTHEVIMGGDEVGYYCGSCNKPMASS